MSKTLKREYCPSCSKNNLCTFETDDGAEIQQCKTPDCENNKAKRLDINIDINTQSPQRFENLEVESLLLDLFPQKTEYRGISPVVCNALGIREAIGNEDFLAQYIHTNLDGSIDIKRRYKDKKFLWESGKGHTTTLFALDKCKEHTKPLYITEGNEDCASIWELGYQACSLLSGTDYGESFRNSLDYINKFSSIILAIEHDIIGKSVKKALKKDLQHKQLFEVDFGSFKDANEVLVTDREFLKQRLSYPTEIFPSGLIQGDQIDYIGLKNKIVRSIPVPWPGLNSGMNGLEYGCLYMFLAGTTTGKSTVLRELAYWYRKQLPELRIGNFFFEENEDVTPLAYHALELNIPLGTLRREISTISDESYEQARKITDTSNLMFIDKKFDRNIDNLLKQIEYLVQVKKFDLIIIDHISYIIGRTGTSRHGERVDIDKFIYALQDLTQRLGCIIVAVSHVNESDSSKRWDQGEVPNIYSGRGSRALSQVPDGIIGLARNITNEYEKSVLSLYNLKNRWHAQTGKTDELIYIEKTGRLIIK